MTSLANGAHLPSREELLRDRDHLRLLLELNNAAVRHRQGRHRSSEGSTMDHECLFWDKQDFMSQIGLVK
jgi:hypothetical protein